MNWAIMADTLRRASNRGAKAMLQAACRAALAKLYRSTGKRHIRRRIHSYQMMLDLRDPGLSRGLMLFRTREVDQKIILERVVRPGMRIFDIGGNIGYYPLLELQLLAGTGELVIIEPVPQNVQLLKRNLEINAYSHVQVIEAAVSDTQRRKIIFLSEHSNLATFHPAGTGVRTLTRNSLEVETVTIPDLAQQFGPPDLLRMDVEGHEVEVIGGMLEDVSRGAYAPNIVFEPHLDRYGTEHDMAEILRKLFRLGYYTSMLSSGSDAAANRFINLGYKAGPRIATDATHRTLFFNIRPDDAINAICKEGGVRTVLLAKQS